MTVTPAASAGRPPQAQQSAPLHAQRLFDPHNMAGGGRPIVRPERRVLMDVACSRLSSPHGFKKPDSSCSKPQEPLWPQRPSTGDRAQRHFNWITHYKA